MSSLGKASLFDSEEQAANPVDFFRYTHCMNQNYLFIYLGVICTSLFLATPKNTFLTITFTGSYECNIGFLF